MRPNVSFMRFPWGMTILFNHDLTLPITINKFSLRRGGGGGGWEVH